MARMDKISKNNTRIVYHPDDSVKMVVLHNTVIYESSPVREDGTRTILISNGGYNTVTTQTRLNQIFNVEGTSLRYSRKNGGRVFDGDREFPIPTFGRSLLLEYVPAGNYWRKCQDSFVVLN